MWVQEVVGTQSTGEPPPGVVDHGGRAEQRGHRERGSEPAPKAILGPTLVHPEYGPPQHRIGRLDEQRDTSERLFEGSDIFGARRRFGRQPGFDRLERGPEVVRARHVGRAETSRAPLVVESLLGQGGGHPEPAVIEEQLGDLVGVLRERVKPFRHGAGLRIELCWLLVGQGGYPMSQFGSERSKAAARPSATASPDSVGTNHRSPSGPARTTMRPSSTRHATRASFAASRSTP